MKTWGLALASVLFLTGCSAVSNPTASSTPKVTMSADQALASFKKIASDSCAKAFSDGVVEAGVDGEKMIMVPKAKAYKDFSALQVDADGTLTLVYEADGFTVCSHDYQFKMAEEQGVALEGLSVAYEDGDYVVTEIYDDVTYEYGFTIKDGLIAAGTFSSNDESGEINFTETYGMPGDADYKLLEEAVNNQLTGD